MDSQNLEKLELQRREELVETENNCCICGAKLNLEHHISYLALTITEAAHCTICGIKNRVKKYTLH